MKQPDTRDCVVQYALNGNPIKYQWHELWSIAVATVYMCVSQGKVGWGSVDCTSWVHDIRLSLCADKLHSRVVRVRSTCEEA